MDSRIELKRWQDQNQLAKSVWEYFDKKASARIVAAAIKHPDINLLDLYHALTRLRAKCEYVKRLTIQVDEIEFYAEQDCYYLDLEFGQYVGGVASESLKPEHWNEDVLQLISSRLISEKNSDDLRLIGLSRGDAYYLEHQPRSSLNESNVYLQQMLKTDNVFVYLCNAAMLVYELANYNVLSRGNAANCSWMINHIFQEKFGKSFRNHINVCPHLQDWIAFFEAPHEYTQFYLIMTTGAILQACGELTEDEAKFVSNLISQMQESPYDLSQVNIRRELWGRLQEIITRLLNNRDLIHSEYSQLQNLLNGNLKFIRPSILLFDVRTHILKSSDISTFIKTLTPAEKEYLAQLTQLHETITIIHFNRVREFLDGVPDHGVTAQLWFDLEVLRRLSILYSPKLMNELKNIFSVKENPSSYYCTLARRDEFSLVSRKTKFLFRTNFQAEKYTASVSQLFEQPDLLSDSEVVAQFYRLRSAILSGGLTIRCLATLTTAQRLALTSPAAIFLYNKHEFIRAEDLLVGVSEEIEANIFKHIVRILQLNVNHQLDAKSVNALLYAEDLFLLKTKIGRELNVADYKTVLVGYQASISKTRGALLDAIHDGSGYQFTEIPIKVFVTIESAKIEKLLNISALSVSYFIQVYYYLSRASDLTETQSNTLKVMKDAMPKYLRNVGISNLRLCGIDFSNITLTYTRFNNCDLSNSLFTKTTLSKVKFEDVKLDDADFNGANITSDCVFNRVTPEAMCNPSPNGFTLFTTMSKIGSIANQEAPDSCAPLYVSKGHI